MKTLGNLGVAYSEVGNHDKAIETLLEKMQLIDEQHQPPDAALFEDIGAVYALKKQHDKSLEYPAVPSPPSVYLPYCVRTPRSPVQKHPRQLTRPACCLPIPTPALVCRTFALTAAGSTARR